MGISYSYGVPFVPTDYRIISHIIDLLSPKPRDIIYELGCGDGRVCIEILSRFRDLECVCVEIRKDLADMALENARTKGVDDRLRIINKDFFKIDLSEATAIYMYLLTEINTMLKRKFRQSMKM
jgi:tRNA1(Val) A37 N6-methylase TrmN6